MSETHERIVKMMDEAQALLNKSKENISNIESFVKEAEIIEPIIAEHSLYVKFKTKILECFKRYS